MTPAQRQSVIAEARSWLRTPYRANAAVKGTGADCAMCPLAIYAAVLDLPKIPPPAYDEQWYLHRSEELYLRYVRALGAVEVEAPEPGDFAIWRMGFVYSHGAIVTDWPNIIHAVKPRGVVLGNADHDELINKARTPLFFTL